MNTQFVSKADRAFLFDVDDTLLIDKDKKTKILDPVVVAAIILAIKIAPKHTKLVTFRDGWSSFVKSVKKAKAASLDPEQKSLGFVIEGLRKYLLGHGIVEPLPVVTRLLPVIHAPEEYLKGDSYKELRDELTKLKREFTAQNIMIREATSLALLKESKTDDPTNDLPPALRQFAESIEGKNYNRHISECKTDEEYEASNSDKGLQYLFAGQDANTIVVIDDDLKQVIPGLARRAKEKNIVSIHYDEQNRVSFIENFMNQLPKSMHQEALALFDWGLNELMRLLPGKFDENDIKAKFDAVKEKFTPILNVSTAEMISQHRGYGSTHSTNEQVNQSSVSPTLSPQNNL